MTDDEVLIKTFTDNEDITDVLMDMINAVIALLVAKGIINKEDFDAALNEVKKARFAQLVSISKEKYGHQIDFIRKQYEEQQNIDKLF